ncbi:MAG: type I polyketide synthase, partial [Leptolyngbyaceae cyanobacterium SU_3_3]|nr:type I polyketide synthase [Leptolyngbyaceae cyanobacterium SU_3_3]
MTGSVENVLLRNPTQPVNTGTPTLSFDQNSNGWMIGEGAGAIVVKRLETAHQNHDRIYAVIDAISLVQDPVPPGNSLPRSPHATPVVQACEQAFRQADVTPDRIGYLEVFGSGIASEDRAEIHGLTQAYRTDSQTLSCAIGSAKSNIGHTYAASGMASLIKTTLCLYHQYLPPTPNWTAPKETEAWQGSPFYVAPASRPWYLAAGESKRIAAINGLGIDRTYAHVILSEEAHQQADDTESLDYLQHLPFYLFPISAPDREALFLALESLRKENALAGSIAKLASQTFTKFRSQTGEYTIALVAHNSKELDQEIQRAFKGIEKAFDQQSEWKTPLGSYFTAKPQGKQGDVTFVYPGAFTSYMGLSPDSYRLFPKTLDSLKEFSATDRIKQLLYTAHQRVYFRSLEKPSLRQLEQLENQLLDDSASMLLAGTASAVGFTMILQDYFQVKPKSAFGYSLGEVSMMSSLNVWTSSDDVASHMLTSPLFKTRITGEKQAVRECWGIAPDRALPPDFWSIYIVMHPIAEIRECLKSEERVYLTQINTPQEGVIAGDKDDCLRVIDRLQCPSFRAPFNDVLHCKPMQSELAELTHWFTTPIQDRGEIKFYSAADYRPLTLTSQTIGRDLARMMCEPIDFPRLINQVYADGARIFVEL